MQVLFRLGRTSWAACPGRVGDRDRGEQAARRAEGARDEHRGPESGGESTLILHWNGTKWEVVPSPSPSPHPDELQGVAVLSGADTWAVGYRGNKTLIERWNGKAWAVQPSPN